MKKKLLFALTLALLTTLVVTAPAFAYTGVTGTVVDGYGNPWTHGGDVIIYNTTASNIAAACSVQPGPGPGTGQFNCVYGADTIPGGIGAPIGPPPANGDQMTIIIDLDCSFSNNNPPPGDGTCTGGSATGKMVMMDYEEAFVGLLFIPFDAGYINTETGPNAVTLAGTSAESPNVWLPAVLGVVALVGAGGVALLLRRRRVA